MGNAVGQVTSIEISNTIITCPDDMEIMLWPGGKAVDEILNNNIGGTPKVSNKVGCITGITARAARTGQLKTLTDLLQGSVDEPVEAIVKLANGEKWSSLVVGTWDATGYYNSGDGKLSFGIYATESGKFVQV